MRESAQHPLLRETCTANTLQERQEEEPTGKPAGYSEVYLR